jgi:hypothetical protein
MNISGISNIPQRLEIAFWITIIPMMKQSPLLGSVVRWGYHLVAEMRQRSDRVRIVVWASSGLLIGMTLGYLTTLIR